MRTDRRGFLRALGGGFVWLGSRRASGEDKAAPAIHRATRNTAIGARGPKRPRPKDPAAAFKTYAGAPRVALPAPVAKPSRPLAEVVRGYTRTSGFEPSALRLELTSRLLHYTNGVTGRDFGQALRAAPSAGALYAGEVYLVAERVTDLPSGVYYYSVREHRLVRLREGSFLDSVADALERPAEVKGAAAAVLLTNVFQRYTWRYRNRGYRYALIDSGHIGENLRLTARSAGLGETAPLRFRDDALNELLGIDGQNEAVCAVHAIGRRSEVAPTHAGPARSLVEKQWGTPEARPPFGALTRRYHEATKLVPAPAGAEIPSPTAPPGSDRAVAASRVALGHAPSASPTPVETAIEVRRSAMAFEPEAIDPKALAFVLEMARGNTVLERSPGVDLYAIVHRVRGLEPGIYRVEPGAAGLDPIRAGDRVEALVDACAGQTKVGRAAVACLMVARFGSAHSELGDRGYRDQLVEAGAVGQRIYLAAETVGLAARNLAAFFDDEIDALLGLEAGREAVIHLTAFGPGD